MAERGGNGSQRPASGSAYLWRLHRTLALYVVGVLGFLALMTWAERQGLSRHWIGPIFLFVTVMAYAGIGVYGRTTDPEEYYVAGRRIPPKKEHSNTPPKPSMMPISNCTPVRREAIRPTP